MIRLERLNKPYYLWRPRQALRRTGQIALGREAEGTCTVSLPWGLEIAVRSGEVVGERLVRRGVFDLALTEAVHRLLDPGDLAVDVGANIGYVTGLAAVRVGPGGRVVSFEPHPSVFEELRANCKAWEADRRTARFDLRPVALSAAAGRSSLSAPGDFERNRGSAQVGAAGEDAGRATEVSTERLDDALPGEEEIALLKLDVEGHELSVLRGAERALAGGRIRDIVFEEHSRSYPTEVTRALAGHGYTLFALGHSLLRPTATPGGAPLSVPHGEELNYLATREPERALARLRRPGWRSLRRRRSR